MISSPLHQHPLAGRHSQAGNQFVYMLKTSSLLSVIGLTELTRRANELVVTEYRPLEIYTFLVLEYLLSLIHI